jgi:hypothetical protein
MSDYTIWCMIEGNADVFDVIIPPTARVIDLKRKIKVEKSNGLQAFDASDLILKKVCYFMISVNINVMANVIWVMSSAG